MTRGVTDGHCQEFVYHMNRINEECGSDITVYHSFHDEVDAAVSDLINSKPHLSGEVTEDVRKCEIKTPEPYKHEQTQKPLETDQDDYSSKPRPKFTKVENNKSSKDRIKDVIRVRFLIFNGRSISKDFRMETRLTEVSNLLPLVEKVLNSKWHMQLRVYPVLGLAGLMTQVTLT